MSFSRISWFILLKRYTLGYYDGVIFHRSACSGLSKKLIVILLTFVTTPAGSYPDFLYRPVIKQAQEQGGSPSTAVRRFLYHHHQVQ